MRSLKPLRRTPLVPRLNLLAPASQRRAPRQIPWKEAALIVLALAAWAIAFYGAAVALGWHGIRL